MFNNQKPDDNVIQPASTKPVNDGLLGLNDDNQDDAVDAGDVVAPDQPSAPSVPIAKDDDHEDHEEPTEIAPHEDVEDEAESLEAPSPSNSQHDDLLNLKRDALEELSPLVDHLDQSAEERFETYLMMIQATDNKDLVANAYKAAKEITDDRKRAQALLDVVNEINYFTQPKK